MDLEHKSAVGVLSDRYVAESTLDRLKEAGIPLNKITLVAQTVAPDDVAISESEFSRHQTIEQLEIGALSGGILGAASGLLLGLASVILPGVGTIVFAGARGVALLGMAVGSFYGAVGGSLLGGAFGNSMSPKQSSIYTDSLLQGKYLVVIEGTDNEIHCAEAILKTQGVQDWGIYKVL
ncbi:hypothetical protein TUMEXPCC7403_08035 [Tumidithrix helvetica PCC 7403]|uniref:DUF1269 domain-containing protein n=1 Tax=Tumidithrix helvetica TaxID=3457545 RepID=UPI003CBEC469